MKITFLGGVRQVTGSRYLVEQGDTKVLVDCGLFQGDEHFTEHNWDAFPVDPKTIDAIVLTHAHIDHTGFIPKVVKDGFRGAIYCSKPTFELCKIMLLDSAKLQEEDAKKINEENPSLTKKAEPLYDTKDAEKSFQYFQPVAYDTKHTIGALTVTLIQSGHILGSAFVVITDGKETLSFSGDLGRPQQLIMKEPPHLKATDYLVLESTYGDRLHGEKDPMTILGDVIRKTVAKGGKVIIPAFAVGRTQMILYYLFQLELQKEIPSIPIYLDSPMAINVTNLYCDYNDEHKLSKETCTTAFNVATYTRDVKESKKIDQLAGPAVIIAGSGMANGGRVVDHFRHFITDPKTTVLFVGYQAEGTLGRELIEHAKVIKIRGKSYPVRATITSIQSLSAHADYEEILEWLSYFKQPIKTVFLTHGEEHAAQSLQEKIEEKFGWKVVIPGFKDSFKLD